MAGGEASHPGATQRLMEYWAHGAGAAKIQWEAPGAFARCQAALREYVPGHMIDGMCANLHKRATGKWPSEKPH